MYQNIGLGAGGITTGLTGVALLPHSSGFRFMFVVSIVSLSLGAAILLATALITLFKRSQKN